MAYCIFNLWALNALPTLYYVVISPLCLLHAIPSFPERKTSAYLFGTIDCGLNLLGITKLAFPITVKIVDDELSKRYEQEIMEFGTTSPMFTVLATLAMINLLCLGGAIKRVVMDDGVGVESFVLQFAQCGLWVLINLPIYEGLFFEERRGSHAPISSIYIYCFGSIGFCIAHALKFLPKQFLGIIVYICEALFSFWVTSQYQLLL
ncbi:cellulose synthase-like protein E6 [Cinnamomum micranthum f. kanehirae]|uniref:Cellulose synthase-like protein E6 n=1 Tax=Cinnamomum micranthum f. kanehirae TaxID=337451 RepID=A0A443P2B0_9MAGN|nr:cellulose synthase-like protein E6 [Cinnamomum micranthum f. kanehirae]